MRVVVVGAGIVGAAVAYETARAGAEVVLVDKGLPGSGVTADSFAWIGGPRDGDRPDAGTPLRRHVRPDYRRWEREVPGVRVRWCGAVDRGEELPDDGAVDPVAVTRALVRAAQGHGAELIADCAVTR